MKKKILLAFSILLLFGLDLSVSGRDDKPWNDQNLRVGDIKIHYLEAGSGDRTLVFIPGWTMIAEVWREQIPYFSARGFRVLALDPRSQGSTTKTETGNTYHQQAADLHAFLQILKIEHSYLVGWSAGATALLEYISSPETLMPEKMVFVDCFPAALRSDDYPGVMTVQQARKLLLGFQDDRAKATDQLVRDMFKAPQAESLIRELTEGSMKTPMGAAASLYFDLFTGDRGPALMHVDVPSLIVTIPENRAIGEYMKSKIPRCNLEVIEGAGHAVFLDKPQAFNQVLESFLGEH
jgi:non-heme chloroperoxidase